VKAGESLDTVARAVQSAGRSAEPIHDLVRAALSGLNLNGRETCVDVGCGAGDLARSLAPRFGSYVGADVMRYESFPETIRFVEVDLDRGRVALEDEYADVVVCVETIEHVENPRALVRELTRLTRPGGAVLVTTPNQLSLHSKLGLLLRNEFPHFQQAPGLYPAHISALLEIDLERMLRECGLVDIEVRYSSSGRIPFTDRYWPSFLSAHTGRRARAFSDNVLVLGRKP
jgi:SAM-dependent methyltransferase